MSHDWSQTLSDIDAKLRTAQFQEARGLFRTVEKMKWPREQIVPLGHLARRLGLTFVILKRLNPIVQPSTPLKKPASPQEISLYCIGLTRIGAFHEAEQRLKAISFQKSPDVQFALGALYMWTWDYKRAIRPFRRYLAAKNLDHYSRMVGKLNLLACLMDCGQISKAFAFGKDFLGELSPGQAPLLRANTLEVLAQGLLGQGSFAEAESCIREAHHILRDTGSDYEIFAKKWSLIIEMRSKKYVDEEQWKALRQICLNRGSFEIVRELDFNRAITLNDSHFFHAIYHGTSFPSYKRRLKRMKENVVILPRNSPVLWNPFLHQESSLGNALPTTVQLFSLPLSQAPHRLLRSLLTDFYRPLQLGEAFRQLYPKEHFNPYSSPARLYAIFLRLKGELAKLDLPFTIKWAKRQLQILPTMPLYIDHSHPTKPPTNKIADRIWAQMRGQVSFTIKSICLDLGVSARSVERRVALAMKKKLLKKLKPGSYTWTQSSMAPRSQEDRKS